MSEPHYTIPDLMDALQVAAARIKAEIEQNAVFKEERWWCAELHRLRGVFLAAMGADEAQIEASFCAAISTAKQQKSISLEKRAEGTYAEYRHQKASGSGGGRIPTSSFVTACSVLPFVLIRPA